MFDMTGQEMKRFRQVVVNCLHISEDDYRRRVIRAIKTEPPLSTEDVYNAIPIFAAGCVLGRLERAIDKEESAPPGLATDDIQAIVEATKGNTEQAVDKLCDCINEITDEAFRYGYYAALEYENVKI